MNKIIAEHLFPSGQRLQMVQGDLTIETVDAIVNAANEHLQHGAGIAAAIVRRGGYQIQEESDAWIEKHGPVTHASPAYTGAGSLPCRYVIHAVGPVWGSGDEDAKLAAAVTGSLAVAHSLSLQSLALPAISTGIFGFPLQRAAQVILTAIAGYFAHPPPAAPTLVRLVLYDSGSLETFQAAWTDIGLAS